MTFGVDGGPSHERMGAAIFRDDDVFARRRCASGTLKLYARPRFAKFEKLLNAQEVVVDMQMLSIGSGLLGRVYRCKRSDQNLALVFCTLQTAHDLVPGKYLQCSDF